MSGAPVEQLERQTAPLQLFFPRGETLDAEWENQEKTTGAK
jgi:hypothetical protein